MESGDIECIHAKAVEGTLRASITIQNRVNPVSAENISLLTFQIGGGAGRKNSNTLTVYFIITILDDALMFHDFLC